MTKDELDLVETQDLMDALERRSDSMVFAARLREYPAERADYSWYWGGDINCCVAMLERLKLEILIDLSSMTKEGHKR